MRIRQYSYFAVSSADRTADEISERLGLAADRVTVAGTKSEAPRRPAAHAWHCVCDERGLTVSEQLSRVVARLEPVRDALVRLAAEPDVTMSFHVVRMLGDEHGEEEALSSPIEGGDKLAGQHQLLGWHLDRRLLEFMLEVGAELDVDEYG